MAKKECSVEFCSNEHEAKGFCKTHYHAHMMKNATGQDTRTCVECYRSAPEVTFQGYRKQCNSCAYYRYKDGHRERNLQKNYGISSSDYDQMLLLQNGMCAICPTTFPGGRKTSNYFHVDHDHTTGKVRGLLCAGCNLAIGHLKESVATARALADYLDAHSSV